MNHINRALLNLLCIGIFASSFFVLGLFNTGSKIADIYRQNDTKKEEVVKHEGEPVERQIMGKKNDGEYLELIIWNSSTEKTDTIKVNASDYDLYKIGEQFYTDRNTITTDEDLLKHEGLWKNENN